MFGCGSSIVRVGKERFSREQQGNGGVYEERASKPQAVHNKSNRSRFILGSALQRGHQIKISRGATEKLARDCGYRFQRRAENQATHNN